MDVCDRRSPGQFRLRDRRSGVVFPELLDSPGLPHGAAFLFPPSAWMNTSAFAVDPASGLLFGEILESAVVRRRIIEYLGGDSLETATCWFLGRLDPLNPSRFERHPNRHLDRLLDEGCELARSLGDTTDFVFHLDVEYVNFDDPAAAYTDPERTFALQEPLVEVIERRLLAFGIRYLHVVTGQGHHFAWKVRKCSPVAKAIARLGICTTPELEAAPEPLFSHAGLLMEHLAHGIKPLAAAASRIPVEITARHVGPGRSGAREMVSIDLSEYGDPLASRMIRIPFTVYRKPWASGLLERLDLAEKVPAFFTLPLHEMSTRELVACRHRPEVIFDLAQRAGTSIPLEEQGTRKLLESYRKSGLADFHRRFYARGHGFPCERQSRAIGKALRRLPPCARHVFDCPNDLLLKPSGIQLVTRCLMAAGWHPRHVAALVAAVFLNPAHGWDWHWDDYDPVLRAEFYVRLFAGEIDQRLERGVDFNCVSQQESGFCWQPHQCSLAPLYERLYRHSTSNLIKS